MSEVKRWLDDEPPAAIRTLLASARGESAPPHLLGRTFAALGVTSATSAAAAATGSAAASHAAAASAATGNAAASSATATSVAAGAGTAAGAAKLGSGMLAMVAQWGGAGLVAGTVVAGAVAGVGRLSGSQTAPPAPRPAVVTPRSTPATNPSPDLPRRLPASPPVRAEAEAPPAPRRAAPALPRDAENPTAREIALVDGARGALKRRDATAVLSALAGYESHFTPAHFEPEVLYLRLEAYRISGRVAEARRLAGLIVARYPMSPEVGRAEELLKGPDNSQSE